MSVIAANRVSVLFRDADKCFCQLLDICGGKCGAEKPRRYLS